jgi:hypothetical protein
MHRKPCGGLWWWFSMRARGTGNGAGGRGPEAREGTGREVGCRTWCPYQQSSAPHPARPGQWCPPRKRFRPEGRERMGRSRGCGRQQHPARDGGDHTPSKVDDTRCKQSSLKQPKVGLGEGLWRETRRGEGGGGWRPGGLSPHHTTTKNRPADQPPASQITDHGPYRPPHSHLAYG